MKKVKKTIIIIIAAIVLCVAAAVLGIIIYGKIQTAKIPDLTFMETLEYTTGGKSDAVVTVGMIKDGNASYTVYGESAKKLPKTAHDYEIGSLTKTFTAALVNKAIIEEKMDIDDTIDKYLTTPAGNEYPTIKELLTHTSGYKGYYFENPMISNFFKGRNDFYGITGDMVLDKAGSLSMDKDGYNFNYSNFGYAVLNRYTTKIIRRCLTALLKTSLALNPPACQIRRETLAAIGTGVRTTLTFPPEPSSQTSTIC